jgi:acyl carrier protein
MSTASYTHDQNAVREFVVEQIQSVGVEPDAISLDATLESLGLDSLDVVELSQSVKKHLGIAVSPKDFSEAVTISDVLSVIRDRSGAA